MHRGELYREREGTRGHLPNPPSKPKSKQLPARGAALRCGLTQHLFTAYTGSAFSRQPHSLDAP